MNNNSKPSNFYKVTRIVFLMHLTLELVRRVQQLGHSLRGAVKVARRLWYSLLSQYYSLRGATT